MIKNILLIDAKTAAQIHFEGMPGDFLAGFGIDFLEVLHRQLLSERDVIPLGWYEQNKLVGILIGTTNTQKALMGTLKKGWLHFLPFVIKKVLQSPEIIPSLWQTVMYGEKDHQQQKMGELIVLSIDKPYRRHGIASSLMQHFKKNLRAKGLTQFTVGTLATNKAANAFYQKQGGHYIGDHKIYGRVWHEYLYDL